MNERLRLEVDSNGIGHMSGPFETDRSSAYEVRDALRDHFAGLALSSLVRVYQHGDYAKGVAEMSYVFADAMLAAREKQSCAQ